jgi:hypothetical protein
MLMLMARESKRPRRHFTPADWRKAIKRRYHRHLRASRRQARMLAFADAEADSLRDTLADARADELDAATSILRAHGMLSNRKDSDNA